MRRKLIIGTALAAALVVAGVAYAATLNKYTASITFNTTKPGTAAKPVPISYKEALGAKNATPGLLAGPLINIKTTIYGMKMNLNNFPTCSSKKIDKAPKYNLNCPKGSEMATGTVDSILTNSTLKPLVTCKPDLVIYNGGGNTEWYFFTAPSATACGGLTTGQTAPYPGKISMSGKNLVINVPLPPDVSTRVANKNNFYGSLLKETVTANVESKKVNGKTVYSQESVACQGGKRPYSVAFTAVAKAGAKPQTAVVKGSAKC